MTAPMTAERTPASSAPRLAYDDPDTTARMLHDASACRAETHLAGALATVLRVPSVGARSATRAVVTVSEQAARFAARLLD